MKRRGLTKALVCSASALALVACSTGGSDASAGEDGETVVTFWHSMRGAIAENLESYADDFNEMQDEIRVDASFQGTYSEATTKVKQVLGTSEVPTLMQLRETTTREIIDTNAVVPIQQFIDEDGFDLSAFEPNILEYYTVDDQLYSMPLNASNAVLFYNVDAFEEAGLDPGNPPNTFTEVREAAETLAQDSTVEYGIALQIYGWLFGQLVSNQGGLIVDNDNGRSGTATEAVFDDEIGTRTMEWINSMYHDGLMGNFGRQSDDMRAAFYNGDAAMILDTTAKTVDHVNEAPFEVGAAYLPVPDGVEATGPVIGGASLWIFDETAEEEQAAAFEFIKYLLSPEVQAHWAANTGYFPITTDSYDEPVLAEQLDDLPQIGVAVDQLHDTEITPASLGALIGVEYESLVADAWEQMYDGGDPSSLLTSAAETVTSALDTYDRANP